MERKQIKQDAEDNFFILNDGTEIILTPGEMKIIKKLREINALWDKFGDRLCLFNGNDLRVIKEPEGSHFLGRSMEIFVNIIGSGGDGGDYGEMD